MLHRKSELAGLANQQSGPGPSQAAFSESKQQLLECLQNHTAILLGALRSYVARAGLASGEQVAVMAQEILQETAVEALAHADRYRAGSQPVAWLLGIAVNIIRRRKRANAYLARREISFNQLSPQTLHIISEEDLLDQLMPDAQAGPEQEIETDEQARALLALVSSEDQYILRLALLEGFDGEALANRLGVSSGAARMRLHRALGRLRVAWAKREDHLQGDAKYE